jgi:putative effector of murein hydrolase
VANTQHLLNTSALANTTDLEHVTNVVAAGLCHLQAMCVSARRVLLEACAHLHEDMLMRRTLAGGLQSGAAANAAAIARSAKPVDGSNVVSAMAMSITPIMRTRSCVALVSVRLRARIHLCSTRLAIY